MLAWEILGANGTPAGHSNPKRTAAWGTVLLLGCASGGSQIDTGLQFGLWVFW